jgi:sugar lactone lactonase YvrE
LTNISVAGNADGVGSLARFTAIYQIAMNTSNENIIYLADSDLNRVRKCDSTDSANARVTTYFTDLNHPIGLVFSLDMKYLYMTCSNTPQIFKLELRSRTVIASYGIPFTFGWIDGDLTSTATFHTPWYLSIDSIGNLYVPESGSNVIRKINFDTNTVITIAGNGNGGLIDGRGSQAGFSTPISVYVNFDGSIIYVADSVDHTIRQVSCFTGI